MAKRQEVSITRFTRWPILLVMMVCGGAMLCVYIWAPSVIAPLDHYNYDLLVRYLRDEPKQDDRLLFVALDDRLPAAVAAAQAQFAAEKVWVTDRQVQRYFFTQLLLRVAPFQPKAVVWDVLFDMPTLGDPDDEASVDNQLARAMATTPTILMAQAKVDDVGRIPEDTDLQYASRFGVGPRHVVADTWPVMPVDLRGLPQDALARAATASGHAIWSVDSDGKNRRIPLIVRVGTGRLFPSLALAAALKAWDADELQLRMEGTTLVIPRPDADAVRVPLDERGNMLVNHVSRWYESIDHESFILMSDSLAGEFADAVAWRVQDRVLVVGVADGESDLIASPVDPALPGALVHHAAINTLLTQQFVRPAPAWFEPVQMMLGPLILGLLYLALLHRPWFAAGATVLVLLGLVAISPLVFVSSSVFLPVGGPLLATALAATVAITLTLAQVTYRSSRLADILSRFVSPALLRELYTQGLKGRELGVQRREIAVLFADVAGFTELTDRSEPEEIAEFLGKLYPVALGVLDRTHGTLDKLLGDGILAYFGAPDELPAKELWAVKAGFELQEGFKKLADEMREKGRGDLAIRVGITTGFVTVGYLGGRDRAAYTIVGRPVNMAARLEAAAAPGQVYIDRKTAAKADDVFELEEVPPLELKGIAKPVPAWRVVRQREDAAIRG